MHTAHTGQGILCNNWTILVKQSVRSFTEEVEDEVEDSDQKLCVQVFCLSG